MKITIFHHLRNELPETNIADKNWWLREQAFPFAAIWAYFQGQLAVSWCFRFEKKTNIFFNHRRYNDVDKLGNPPPQVMAESNNWQKYANRKKDNHQRNKSKEEVHTLTNIDRWFLSKLHGLHMLKGTMRLADGDVCLGDLIGYNKAYCACLVFVGYILTYCIFFKCIYMIYMHTDINIIYIYIYI